MEEIIRLLYENSDKHECLSEAPFEVVFKIGYFHISLQLLNEDLDYDDTDHAYVVDSIDEFIGTYGSDIREMKVSLIEYLGDRNDSAQIDREKEKYFVSYIPNSFSKMLFETIQIFGQKIPGLTISYHFETHFSESALMCDGEPNYVASILIDSNKLNRENIADFIQILLTITEKPLEKVYWPAFFDKEKSYFDKIKDPNSFEPQFLNTNTKVRRLGYLKVFFKLMDEKKKIPSNFLSKKYEEYAVRFNNLLSESKYQKGLIQALNGTSSEPYIDLLKQFQLIESINRLTVPSKSLKVYLELSRKQETKSNNPFVLTELDKLFFCELILQKDFLYTSIILELIYISEDADVNFLVKNFQKKILSRLSDFLSQTSEQFEQKKANEIKTIKRRIEEWKKPEVYLEHIIMPRVNWLADLSLIVLEEDNTITLLDEGKRLFESLLSWIDVSCEFIENSTHYLKRFSPHILGLTYKQTPGDYPELSEIYQKIDSYIEESFSLFKTLAPNRITVSQAFTFTKYSFYLNDGYSVSERYLERIILEKFSDKYIYKYQQQYQDGYIQKVKTTN